MRRAVLAALAALPATALAEEAPRLSGELSLGLFGVSTYRAPDRERRFRDLYAKGEFEAALELTEALSLHGVLKFEPVAGGPTGGQDRAFQDQGAFVESLFAEWQATEALSLRAGKFTAPFGTGHATFPGIRLRDQAEAYEIAESLGFGARWTLLPDRGGIGEHALSAAVFAFDTSSLSSTFLTRKRLGRDEAERFRRNSRGLGGAGNSEDLDNAAIALDGEGFGLLPGLSYHLGLLTRAAGVDGMRREWGLALGAAYRLDWTEELSTRVFAEWVRFRDAGGRPLEDVDGTPTPVRERRSIATIGAQTSYGPWRAVLAFQQDEGRRSANARPTESYLEVSAGRELGWGFALDVGWSRTRYARDTGEAGRADALLGLLSWKAEF